MGYRRGYDCDICGKDSEDSLEFVGMTSSGIPTSTDDADFHFCLRCAREVSKAIIRWDAGASNRQRILNGETP